jgi:hypothetical protein
MKVARFDASIRDILQRAQGFGCGFDLLRQVGRTKAELVAADASNSRRLLRGHRAGLTGASQTAQYK